MPRLAMTARTVPVTMAAAGDWPVSVVLASP
jgi:hypothetical protein